MIKGVNRQVVELNGADSEYFERILFFVKPECCSVSEGKLRERANLIASQAGAPPTSKITRNKVRKTAELVLAATAGALASGLVFFLWK